MIRIVEVIDSCSYRQSTCCNSVTINEYERKCKTRVVSAVRRVRVSGRKEGRAGDQTVIPPCMTETQTHICEFQSHQNRSRSVPERESAARTTARLPSRKM